MLLTLIKIDDLLMRPFWSDSESLLVIYLQARWSCYQSLIDLCADYSVELVVLFLSDLPVGLIIPVEFVITRVACVWNSESDLDPVDPTVNQTWLASRSDQLIRRSSGWLVSNLLRFWSVPLKLSFILNFIKNIVMNLVMNSFVSTLSNGFNELGHTRFWI